MPDATTNLAPRRPAERVKPNSKVGKLCAQLTSMAYELGPEARMPTLACMQEELGVTFATINRALRLLESQHIVRTEHGKGIFVASRVLKTVSFLCDPSFFRGAGASPFWSILLEQTQAKATEYGRSFTFHFTMPYGHRGLPLHEEVLTDFVDGRIHGVLAIGVSGEVLELLEEFPFPVVGFATPARDAIISTDRNVMLRLGVQALHAQGCRHIGLWRPVGPYRPGDEYEDHAQQYLEPFQEALGALGLTSDDRLVRVHHPAPGKTSYVTQSHQEQGYRIAKEIFGSDHQPRPDGLLITDDLMTQGAIAAFYDLGIRIGRDLIVATQANKGSMTLHGYEDKLSLIEFDPEEIATTLMSELNLRIENPEAGKDCPREIFINPRLR